MNSKMKQNKIRSLKAEIETLEETIEDLKLDREKFRSDLISNLKTAIRIHGEQKYWNMDDLIQTFSRQIASKEWWYW